MKLYSNGIYRNTQSVVLIEELKRVGYVEIKEPEEIPAQVPTNERGDPSSEVKQGEPEKEVTPEVVKAPKEPKKAGK